MQSTASNFWKMVHDRKCGVIVMLSDLVEGGQVRMVATLATGSGHALVSVSPSRKCATSTGQALGHRGLESSQWSFWGRRGCRALC